MPTSSTDPTQPTPITRRERRSAFLVAALLFACYLLTYTGSIQSSDGLAMFATTESIVRRGEVDTNQLLWMGLQQGSFGPDGELYSRKGLGMTLLALPLVWLARLWPALGLTQTHPRWSPGDVSGQSRVTCSAPSTNAKSERPSGARHIAS